MLCSFKPQELGILFMQLITRFGLDLWLVRSPILEGYTQLHSWPIIVTENSNLTKLGYNRRGSFPKQCWPSMQLWAQLGAIGAPTVGDSMYMPATVAQMSTRLVTAKDNIRVKRECRSRWRVDFLPCKEPSASIGL